MKYAECWVYANVLTSLLRCVGVPARPLTAVPSATDSNGDKFIDIFIGPDKKLDRTRSETYWKFHVWCDAWMKRPDRAGMDGWQAVDPTYGFGPAPLLAIKDDTAGAFDVNQFFAAVSGQVRGYLLAADGSVIGTCDVYRDGQKLITGKHIVTKSVGSNSADPSVRGLYKTGTAFDRPEKARFTDGIVGVDLLAPEVVNLGSNLVWQAVISNASPAAISCRVVLAAAAVSYRGDLVAELGSVDQMVPLGVGEVQFVSLGLSESDYLPWVKVTRSLECSLYTEVVGANNPHFELPSPTIVVDQSVLLRLAQTNVHLGETVPLRTTVTNSSGVLWSNLVVTVDGGADATIDGLSSVTWSSPVLPSGVQVLFTNTIAAASEGKYVIFAFAQSDLLQDLSGFAELQVGPPLTITASRNSQGQIALRFTALSGRRYHVERKGDLRAAAWTTMGAEIVGAGGETEVIDLDPPVQGQRFYRVVVLSEPLL